MCKTHYQKFTCSHRIFIQQNECQGKGIIAWFNQGFCMQGTHTEYISTPCYEYRRLGTPLHTTPISIPSSTAAAQKQDQTNLSSPSFVAPCGKNTAHHHSAPLLSPPIPSTTQFLAPPSRPDLRSQRRRTFDFAHTSSATSA